MYCDYYCEQSYVSQMFEIRSNSHCVCGLFKFILCIESVFIVY